jgi:hypothetical protein
MRKIVLTFGLLSGAVLSAMMALTIPFADRVGFDTMEVVGYATMVAAALLVYFGVRRYRDEVGGVSFGRAFAVGALIVVVASVCYTATWQVIYRRFAPDFIAKMQAHALEQERAGGAAPAELEARRAEMERFAKLYENPAVNVAVTFVEPLPVGLLGALISAALLRRRRQEGDAVAALSTVA